jgi:hypothetical protein
MEEKLLDMINSSRSQETAFGSLEEACEVLPVYEIIRAFLWVLEDK